MKRHRLILVDDEKDMREFLEIMRRKEGYDARGIESAQLAIDEIKEHGADLVISDVRMPGMGGLEFLKALRALDPTALVLMITAYASVETAIDAMKAGAYDYFIKPFNIDEVKLTIKKALELKRLERENRLLKDELKARLGFSNIVGTSQRMAEVYSLIMSVARTRTNVFITGESGTGKGLIARAIHNESDRKEGPFVAVNCGAIPENLIESELFGHVKGAFTGALAQREGLAEQADGGTLFLDEITELPLHLQVKLLRFIQERSIRRVGGAGRVAAANRALETGPREGRFREALFYRLNVIRIQTPPLRERKEDIPHLVRHFIDKFNRVLGKAVSKPTEDAFSALMDYDYPGNVRELENIIERAVTLAEGPEAGIEQLPAHVRANAGQSGSAAAAEGREPLSVPVGGMDLEKTVEDFEKAIITDALKKSGGVKKKAAELLGLSFRSMRYKLGKYGISED